MNIALKQILTVVACLLAQQLYGQHFFDTTHYKSDLSGYLTKSAIEKFNFELQTEDTLLKNVHILNKEKQTDLNFINLGRIASPTKGVEPSMVDNGTFHLNDQNPTKYYFKNPDSIKYYESNTPRTNFKYAQGTANLLLIEAEYSQNLNKYWSYGLDYSRIKCNNLFFGNLDFFNREKMSDLYATNVFSHFRTEKRNYELLAHYTSNKLTLKETNSILNDSAFYTYSGRNRFFSAEAAFAKATNVFWNKSAGFTQYFRNSLNDSLALADSQNTKVKNQWFHTFEYRTEKTLFSDPNPNTDLYPIRHFTLTTKDSTKLYSFINKIGKNIRTQNTFTTLFVQHEYNNVSVLSLYKSKFQHLRLAASFDRKFEKLSLKSAFQTDVMGFYKSDYQATIRTQIPIKKFYFTTGITSQKRRPDYLSQFFASNNYLWHQRLSSVTTNQIICQMSYPNKFSVGFIFRHATNFVYFDSSGYRKQWNDAFKYSKFWLSHHTKIGNSWHLHQRISVQNSLAEVLPVPRLSYTGRIYKEGFLFKKNMYGRAGVQAGYYSAFDGYTYNPLIRRYVVSHQSIGGYPVIDFFVDVKVKTVKLFVSLENVSQGFFENDTYSAFGYPQMSRMVNFGIDWRMFN
ncbi:MAG: hypothetical protein H6607_02010 [Flavobacteriales bacterium]|nr:hypothetical protein [Flavobacteriales bacterium]